MRLLQAMGFQRRPTFTYWVCRCGFTNPSEFSYCWQCALVKVRDPSVPEELVFKCLSCGSQFSKPISGWFRFAKCPECGHHHFSRMTLFRCGHFVRVGAKRCEICTKAGRVREPAASLTERGK